MEAQLKQALGSSLLKAIGYSGGGCISQGQSYETERGRVFVKINHKPQARKMFLGEMASLEAILQTNTVKVPKPIKVIDLKEGGSVFAMEHLDMRSLNRHSAKLGEQLGELHLHNQKLGEKMEKEQNIVGKGASQSELQYIDQFGFHTVTCCGYLPQVNDWQSDWATFYASQRLQTQLEMIEKEYGDREARELWSQLQARRMFLGEMASLEAILQTNTVRVPKPVKVIDLHEGGSMLAMDHLPMRHIHKYSAKLGEQIADLHLHNQKLGEKLKKDGSIIGIIISSCPSTPAPPTIIIATSPATPPIEKEI